MRTELLNTIHNIDCLDGFKMIPENSIDLILTDPPYGLNKAGIKNDQDLSLFYASLPESYRVLKKILFILPFLVLNFYQLFLKIIPLNIFGILFFTAQMPV